MVLEYKSGPQYLKDDSTPEQQAQDLLVRFGHLKQRESLSQHLIADLNRQAVKVSDIHRMCVNIEESRATFRELGHQTLVDAIHYGLKNLSNINLTRKSIIHTEMLGYNLNGAGLIHADCRNTDFTGSTFEEARLDWTNFSKSPLHKIEASSIRIRDVSIDLMLGAIQINYEDSWNVLSNAKVDEIGDCGGCEEINRVTLDIIPGAEIHARRGIVLFERQKPLGYIKLKGERSFLPMRTVRNYKGETIFWKGMIYALDEDLREYLETASFLYQYMHGKWRRADVEVVAHDFRRYEPDRRFGMNNLRFIDDPSIYSRLDELRKSIEEGKEECEDILPTESVQYRQHLLDTEA
ncbi:hypothetical protein A3C86_03690 [Candidatus Kaiserbacteria bacterium RIFCSPHIGHO2_02_FULL_49_16]|uniref:Pentapeptide repeat protein n=1 Tax=Candidatus Kaiserbacteria bacterium RIFCSPHIGHO2_02_FULL_49_16 TaxID=1798490 RepID=A0A1F6DA46_9BACT|nr:MAG: hypothetical protein A3C86_03690 [Candidatus Kaiserbacteria bacterium RIFCSPHIGHO2_02_FULL_49_16]